MGLLSYFRDRRARESAIPGSRMDIAAAERTDEPSTTEIDMGDLADLGIGEQLVDPAEDPGLSTAESIGDLFELVKGSLQEGNATVTVDGEAIDLREGGVRGGMFEPLEDGESGRPPSSADPADADR